MEMYAVDVEAAVAIAVGGGAVVNAAILESKSCRACALALDGDGIKASTNLEHDDLSWMLDFWMVRNVAVCLKHERFELIRVLALFHIVT